MKIQVHNYSTARGGERIGKYQFRNIAKSLREADFIEDNTEQSVYSREDIGIILIAYSVGLRYSYSPGVGSLPNEREEINAFGQFDKISKLCEILKEKGLPIKSITFENTKL